MNTEKAWITSIQRDLPELKEQEKFQRHEPQYYAEWQYKKDFFDFCPDSLIASKAMVQFFCVYKNGGSLYDAVTKFLEVYNEDKEEGDAEDEV